MYGKGVLWTDSGATEEKEAERVSGDMFKIN
jgi:hypothetical protein